MRPEAPLGFEMPPASHLDASEHRRDSVAPASFDTLECVGARVAAAHLKNWDLLSFLRQLREELSIAEAEASLCGTEAMTMPEDLGSWSSSGPRIQGVVARIHQTNAQSQALSKAVNAEVGDSRRGVSPATTLNGGG